MPISAPPLPISWEIVTIAIAPSFPARARGARAGPNRSDGGESVVCLLHLVKERLDKFEGGPGERRRAGDPSGRPSTSLAIAPSGQAQGTQTQATRVDRAEGSRLGCCGLVWRHRSGPSPPAEPLLTC